MVYFYERLFLWFKNVLKWENFGSPCVCVFNYIIYIYIYTIYICNYITIYKSVYNLLIVAYDILV